jgi:hypothetical protein
MNADTALPHAERLAVSDALRAPTPIRGRSVRERIEAASGIIIIAGLTYLALVLT